MRVKHSKSISVLKRIYKRTSNRKLSSSDISVLDFLWTWKVASPKMLKLVAYPDKSDWWMYKAIRQLIAENYIMPLPRGKYLDQEVLTLTQLGFEIVLMDRDDITQYRYKPHAPAHDFLATCLQLGDLWLSNWDKVFFTEQMLASLRANNFPKNYVNGEGHVPDGITLLKNGLKSAAIGYEVDLNLKESDRYEETFNYYNQLSDVQVVFWLVRNDWIAERIKKITSSCYGYDPKKNKFQFIRLEEFKKEIWSTKVFSGSFANLSIRKVHENLMQSLGKMDATLGQRNLIDTFFGKYKSPQKSKFCANIEIEKSY